MSLQPARQAPQPPDWLMIELRDGLRKLVSLSLESPPSAGLIGATLLTWAETLTAGRAWDEGRDAPRIRTAFRTLAARCRRWPVPADFFDALPKPAPTPITRRLDDEARRTRGLQQLAAIAARLRVAPAKAPTEVDDDDAA